MDPVKASPTLPLDPAEFLPRFDAAAGSAGFTRRPYGTIAGHPLNAYTKRTAGRRPRIYLSTGMHGDEPAPPWALLRLLEAGTFDGQATWFLCPLLNPTGFGMQGSVSPAAWALLALLLISGFLVIIGLSRAGVRYFLAPTGRALPRLRLIETAPIAALLVLVAVLVWQADAVLRFVNHAAVDLHQPDHYIAAVVGTAPMPPAASFSTHPSSPRKKKPPNQW